MFTLGKQNMGSVSSQQTKGFFLTNVNSHATSPMVHRFLFNL